MNRYNASTGIYEKILFEEKNDKYVEPQHSMYFLNNEEFVCYSQRDGYMHLYRYNIDGKLLNTITQGNWLVHTINGKDLKKNELIITATKETPLEKNLYIVNWKSGKISKLNANGGIHTAFVNDEGKYVLDHYQSAEVARKIDLIAKDKAQIKN